MFDRSAERYGLMITQIAVALAAILFMTLWLVIRKQRQTLRLYELRFGRISDQDAATQTEAVQVGPRQTLVEQRRAAAATAAAALAAAPPPPPIIQWRDRMPDSVFVFSTGKAYHTTTGCQNGGREYRRCCLCCTDAPLPYGAAPLPRAPILVETTTTRTRGSRD